SASPRRSSAYPWDTGWRKPGPSARARLPPQLENGTACDPPDDENGPSDFGHTCAEPSLFRRSLCRRAQELVADRGEVAVERGVRGVRVAPGERLDDLAMLAVVDHAQFRRDRAPLQVMPVRLVARRVNGFAMLDQERV